MALPLPVRIAVHHAPQPPLDPPSTPPGDVRVPAPSVPGPGWSRSAAGLGSRTRVTPTPGESDPVESDPVSQTRVKTALAEYTERTVTTVPVRGESIIFPFPR